IAELLDTLHRALLREGDLRARGRHPGSREREAVLGLVGTDVGGRGIVDHRDPVGREELRRVPAPAGRQTAVDDDVDVGERRRRLREAEALVAHVDFHDLVAALAELAEQELLVLPDTRVEDAYLHAYSPQSSSSSGAVSSSTGPVATTSSSPPQVPQSMISPVSTSSCRDSSAPHSGQFAIVSPPHPGIRLNPSNLF